MKTTPRFEITPVEELYHDQISFQPSEIVPLINTKTNVLTLPPTPSSFTFIDKKNKSSPRLFHSLTQRLKTSSSVSNLTRKNSTSSLRTIHYNTSTTNLNNHEEVDSTNSTIHSHTFDTNSLRITNKFLHELRLKRRELHDKGRNLSIDQRIALNRFQYDREIEHAQDIFDVHFELNDDDDNNDNNIQSDLFNEDTQEQIRNNIFHELYRQRMKQLHKEHQHLIFGRALLMFVTSLLILMSITLIYVVTDLYGRANCLDAKLDDSKFLSMTYDETTNI